MKTGKKTVVLGASTNPGRASYAAVERLRAGDHEVVPIGVSKGAVAGIPILEGKPQVDDVHTVSLYLNPKRQEDYYEYILGLNPKRIIFNPGTENAELIRLARQNGIEAEVACTLVMLSLKSY